MDEMKISLSPDAEQNTDEAIQCLIEAASQVFTSSEQDFQEIKNTKWYQRLWKIVTFSKDNEKKIANGVANLVKLQEIVMKALLLLAEKSATVSDFVCKHEEQIAQLSRNQARLARTQNAILDELDRLKSGAEKTITLYDIEGEKRKIFMTAFCSVVDAMNFNTSLCQEYYRQVCHALKFSDPQTCITISKVDMLTRRESLLLFRVILEYVYLGTDSFDFDAEILKYLAVSPKDSETMKKFIANQVLRGGREILITNNFVEEYNFIEEDDINWDFDKYEQNDVEFNEEYTEIILNEIMHIGANDTYTYKKKKINLKAIIECEGNLVFEDCEIFIDDSEAPKSSIELTGNGSITFSNCSFFMLYKLSDFLISTAKNTIVSLQNCFFNGCGMFIETAGHCEVDSCEFLNPGANLVSSKSWNKSDCAVRNSVFRQLCYPSHIEYGGSEEYSSILNGITIFDNCKVERDDNCFFSNNYGKKMVFLESDRVNVNNITFKNWINCIKAYGGNGITVEVSEFEKCGNVISANQLDVKNCNFYSCFNPIMTSEKSVVSHCQFYKCSGTLITSTNPIDIKYCLFDTYMHENYLKEHIRALEVHTNAQLPEKNFDLTAFCANAIISIKHEKESKGFSQIEKSRFYNIDVGTSYIIKCNDYVKHENILLKISDCEFSNCKSLRKDKKIIRRTSLLEHFPISALATGLIIPLFSAKALKEFANVYLYNCSGVCPESGTIRNGGRSTVSKFIPREFTTSNEKIGCSL